jgi:dihydropteroate synthase
VPEPSDRTVIVRSPGLNRGFALSGTLRGRLYLRPAGLLSGAAARAACQAGFARPLTGGPLAFTLCEVLVRREGRIEVAVVPLAEFAAQARAAGEPVEAHLETLLQRCTEPRPPFAGLGLERPRLMGIVNATPDSFSDGGDHLDPAAAIARGRALADAGADIIDVGGESTRPGAAPVGTAEEWRRVAPVLAGLRDGGAVLSIDTRHAAVMASALDAGAAILNDVTALAGEAESLPLAARRGVSVVLMHMQGEPRTMNDAPRYAFAPLDVFDALEARVEACAAAGIPRGRIAVDPGLGFGKRTRHNLELLAYLSLFHGLGTALLVGASRKLLVGASRKAVPATARLGASLGAALYAAGQGVQLLRVHDVAETRQALDIWQVLQDDG